MNDIEIVLGDFNALLGKKVIYEQKGSKSQTEKFDCEAAVQRVLWNSRRLQGYSSTVFFRRMRRDSFSSEQDDWINTSVGNRAISRVSGTEKKRPKFVIFLILAI